MRKWRTDDIWAAAIVGALAVGPTAGLIAMSGDFFAEEGVTLRGRDLHGRVIQYRVFPDRYYIEYRDHTIRCVADSAPWGPVSAKVREHLNPTRQELFVDAGVLAPE